MDLANYNRDQTCPSSYLKVYKAAVKNVLNGTLKS